jgi:adenylosuccinate synthase
MFTCVTDLAFGDTGKGKIVDAISHQYDTLVRFNGGPNAGHTIVVNGEKYSFHNLPSGMFSDNPPETFVLSGGMVVNPISLAEEIKKFRHKITNLILSNRMHCIMPWHIAEDTVYAKDKIGTTGKGIGPCYAAKMNRVSAIRLGDLKTKLIECRFDDNETTESYMKSAEYLQEFIGDDVSFLREKVKAKQNILFESANGIHLDIDHGTYPYVTSSGCGPAYIPQSCGLPNFKLDNIIGITKAYMTRVGNGPLPTELFNEMGDSIRKIGNEYGTTTGRSRRIGWLDLDTLKVGVANTGATELAITHLDTLIAACKENNRKYFVVKVENDIREFPVWESIEDLAFARFIEFVEKFLGIPANFLGTGRDRKELIMK